METYLVGGAVRDELLGRPVTDRDYVVVGATPQEMRDLGFKQVGADFPVFLHPGTHCEYALARTERKVAPGYRGFVVHAEPTVRLEDDLARRDLTINAMARAADGTLIDPYGGLADLRAGILRHVSPAFREDPVRILRVARFAARFGFQVASSTVQLMRQMVAAGEADHLVAERVFVELERALGEPHPELFVDVLRETGALQVQFPEIDRLFGVPQVARYHPEIDTGVHTRMTLMAACALSAEPRVRFAALVHDLGKGLTPREEWPSHRAHERRGVPLVAALCERLRVPGEWRALALAVAGHHLTIHRALELKPLTIVRLIEALDAIRRPMRWQELLLACMADARGRLGREQMAYPQADFLREAQAACAAVSGAAFARQGLRGPAIAQRVRRARVMAVATLARPVRATP
ncbi:MAG: multifunctional CCA addition/repair protein [Gammaproteobacteria bacterium]|nr:multifunctional CCA addition/repair protein [Gammaproteobacteria bacterium]